MMDLPGYHIVERVYEGQSTVILRARQEQKNTSVIVKLLKGEYPSPEELSRINHEFSILNHLSGDQGLIAYLDVVDYNNSKAIIIEDIGGQALGNILKESGKLDLGEALEIAIKLCDFLEKVHENHIIHKDIKPQNIIYNRKTGQVRLIDFSISTLAPRTSQEAITPNHIEGTLHYMSPEQTGRMNRNIDYRTDFYSFGATLYEMLTGTRPFESDDPMELVHCHIARKPRTVIEANPEMPEIVSQIVMKLLNKNAEDRYQLCSGLKADLDRCFQSLSEHGSVEAFELRTKDTPDRFQVPEKLYGREKEVAQLLERFARVSQGNKEILMVRGESGIGKSVLIFEIHKPIVERRGFFTSGKYEQYKRNIPYSAITQAFQSLIRQILTQTESEIALWKEKILAAVGNIGQVIVDVIPQVELIIGEQPKVQDLPAQETSNRFHFVFKRFLRAFADKLHPLVLFLDDLQWADQASLQFLPTILTDPSLSAFLFIGAYRNNEVEATHPLNIMLKTLSEDGEGVGQLELGPLNQSNIRQVLDDTIDIEAEKSDLLAEIAYQKTHGNPFFLAEFLKTLHQKKMIRFEHGWHVNIEEIKGSNITDNVVELMTSKISLLPGESQKTLKLASCVGTEFHFDTLIAVSDRDESKVIESLTEAINEGMVLQVGKAYRFVHDRVCEAAYSLITDEEAEHMHHRIGMAMLTLERYQPQEDHVFSIVNHLDRCKAHLGGPEIERWKELNLLAAKTAKSSGAWDAALGFLMSVRDEFPDKNWDKDYTSTLEYFEELAETLHMSVNHAEFLQTAEFVLDHAKSDLDKTRIQTQLINYYTNQQEYQKAIEIGVLVLKKLGMRLPLNPSEMAALPNIIKIKLKTRNRDIRELLELPELSDSKIRTTLETLQEIGAPAYISRPNLLPLIVTGVALGSLKYGNFPISSYSYTAYGFILAGALGDIDKGYEFGQLGLDLASKYGDTLWLGKVHYLFHFISHWKNPLDVNIKHLEKSIAYCQESGNHQFLGWCYILYPYNFFAKGETLERVRKEIGHLESDINKLDLPYSLLLFNIFKRFCSMLQNPSDDPTDFTGEGFREKECLEKLEESTDQNGLGFFYIVKTIILYLNDRFEQACDIGLQHEEYVAKGCVSQIYYPLFYFYLALSLARAILHSEKSSNKLKKYKKSFRRIYKMFKKWGAHNPYDYYHKFLILKALHKMIIEEQTFLAVLKSLDDARAKATENKYIQDIALANEIAADFCQVSQVDKVAQTYLADAYYYYQKWGCVLKINLLNKKYPNLLDKTKKEKTSIYKNVLQQAGMTISHSTSTTSGAAIGQMLDLKSVLDATQALSSTIEMENLLAKIIKIVIESGGGDKGCLVLIDQNESQTVVKARVDSDQWIIEKKTMDDTVEIAKSVVRYVVKTKEMLLLSDASKDKNYSLDQHVKKNNVRSVLCVPLINQARLIGVLYLENNLSAGAFTADRVDLLKVLSTQAAISLENAQLYSNMEQKVIERTQELENAQKEMLDIAHRAGMAEIAANVLHNIGNILNSVTTSANLVRAEMKSTRMSAIGRANNLVRENMDNLEEFLVNDNRGRKLIKLYFGIEKAFEKEQESITGNLDRLDHHIEAVKEIVDAQQSYAEGGLFFEQVSLSDMIEKMLILKNETTQSQGIEIIKEFEDIPNVSVQRAKLLHVLVNLFDNSIEAMTDLPEQEKELKFVLSSEDSAVCLKIEDNGEGIDSDDIFGHGTVTKRDGKGFGLHGCAVAMKEMKGTISAKSKNQGRGAVFTLSFPIE